MLTKYAKRWNWLIWATVTFAGVLLLLVLLTKSPGFKSSQVQVIKAIPVIIDFNALPKPENGELSIEAEGSMFRSNDNTHRIVFWKPDDTINIDGVIHRFDCSGGGTIFTRVTDRYVYYDCASSRIAVSRLAYHARVVNFDASTTYIANDAWKLVAKGSSLKTPSNWLIEASPDETILIITTPVGEQYEVTKDQVLLRDGDSYLLSAKGETDLGYMFSLGFGSQLRLVVIRANNEWIVAENNN